MAEPDAVLMDNNAISEACRVYGWNALVGRYRLETVEAIAVEAFTGYQHRPTIDPREFKAQVAVHNVPLGDQAAIALRATGIALDEGERDLWAHAVGRQDSWILCGPDRASIRFAVRLGLRDRLVSLEALFDQAGFRPRNPLKEAYTKKWLDTVAGQYVVEEGVRR